MPPGSKRKFNSYQEPPGTTMARQPSNRAVFVQRPVPTPETQELYNRMRQEEEKQLTQESLSQMQNGHNGFLQPPSPSQLTASSPSPSYASTTHSISQALGDMGVDDQPQAKKPRPGRHGPLPESKKLRAALMRKLGACEDCRERKVKCSHFDLTLFEDAYRATQRVATQPINNGYHPAPTSPYRPPLGDSSVDLRGVGTGQNATGHLFLPSQGEIQTGRDEVNAEFDLVQNQPLRPDLQLVLTAFERRQPPVPSHSPRYPLVPSPTPRYAQELPPAATTESGHEVPIGKQHSPYSQEWVCLWANHEYGSWSRGELGPCNQNFDSLETLKQHFATFHVPFYRERRSWQCISCQLDMSSPDLERPCPQCSQPFTWHEWCWARLSIPSSPPSLSLGPVPSQYGSPSSHSSRNPPAQFYSPSGGGHNNSWTFPFGGYGYSSGSGSGGYHYTAASPPTGPKQSSTTTCCEKPTPLATCHLARGSSLITDMWHPRLYPSDKNAAAGKTALLRHACPAAVVLAVFLIALVNSWLFTGRGRGGGVDHIVSGVVSSIFPGGQIKILDLSVPFIVAGVGVSWLVRHVKARWKQGFESQRCVRGDVRGVADIWHFGEDRPGPVGIAAA